MRRAPLKRDATDFVLRKAPHGSARVVVVNKIDRATRGRRRSSTKPDLFVERAPTTSRPIPVIFTNARAGIASVRSTIRRLAERFQELSSRASRGAREDPFQPLIGHRPQPRTSGALASAEFPRQRGNDPIVKMLAG